MTRKLSEKQRLFEHVEVPDGLMKDASQALKPCALCGTTSSRRIYIQAHFPVVRCRDCGLVFADEHFRETDLESFYTGDYYQRAYVCHPKEIDSKIAGEYLREFRRVDRLMPAGGRVLDFGSARGTFIGELMSSDLAERWEPEGIDINPDEVEMGKAKGFPVRVANVFDDSIPGESFDAITAFSVLEHMQDPRATLEALHRVLKPGGKLLLIVPNGSCLIILFGLIAARLLGDRVRGFTDNVFHEEHLYYFDPRTMPKMLEQCGFSTHQVGFQPSYLETHPPGPIVALGATALRVGSWMSRRQTMLLVVAEKR